MRADAVIFNSLVKKLPFSLVEENVHKAKLQIRAEIRDRFNKWLLKTYAAEQEGFQCVKLHLNPYHCQDVGDGDVCDEENSVLTFTTSDIRLRIEIAFNYEDEYIRSLYILLCSSTKEGRIINTKPLYWWNIINIWEEDETNETRTKKLKIKTTYKPPIKGNSWEKYLPNINILERVKKFCRFLTNDLPKGMISREDFYKHQKNAPVTKIYQKISELYYDYMNSPIKYVHNAVYTFMAIHKYRPDSLIARLPKDVAKLVAKAILDTKYSPEWE